MSFAIPAAIGLGSSIFGGIARGGNQGGRESTVTRTGSLSEVAKNLARRTGYQQATEPADFSAFRSGLIPLFGQEYRKVQQPIFGDAQKAAVLNDLNELARDSIASLRGELARSGALDSGRLAKGLSDIEGKRLSEAVKFFSQLPAMEEQARRQATSNLLGLGTSFAGRAPVSYLTGGEESGEATRDVKENQTIKEMMKIIGTPWWKNTLGTLAGIGMDIFGDMMGGWNALGGGPNVMTLPSGLGRLATDPLIWRPANV